jgi:chaperonin GroEL
MYTNVHLRDWTFKAMGPGISKVAKAVGATMGPLGRNAVINNGYRTYVTRDGVTVANSIKLQSREEQAGAELLQRAAQEVDSDNGDGTTTVTVLTHAILKEAMPLIEDGINPMVLKREIEESAEEIIKYIKENTYKIENVESLEKIATIAASDEAIGKMVASLVWELGPDALITLQGGQSTRTELEMVTGVQVRSGLASPYLVRDPAVQQTSLEEPYIILCDRVLRDKEDILPILKIMNSTQGSPALLMCHEITTDALNLLVLNSIKQVVNIVAVNVPQEIVDKTSYLQDIACVTGATVIGKDNGVRLEDANTEHFGKVQSVTAGMEKTVIVRGMGADEDVEARKQTVLKLMKDKSKYLPDLKERLAVLQGRVAIITIGGNSQSEIDERHFRFEDAVGASKTALRGGMVPGAGVNLFNAVSAVKETSGGAVLANALKYPSRILLDNAGIYSDNLFDKIGGTKGINVLTGKVVDLYKAGILDPSLSNVSSVNVAVSTAGLIMTAGSLIVNIEEDNDKTKQ